MYLISVYFDDNTNVKINQLIKKVAEKTGNLFMVDGNVPPHITISAFETKNEKEVIERLHKCVKRFESKDIQWVSVGTFMPHVLYITPVLNEYLHNMMVEIYDMFSEMEDIIVRKCYQPFAWLPHTTISKTLDKEQMQEAFKVMQEMFVPFMGTVVRIGLSKTNPYQELEMYEL